jgi:hypothetical protein
MKPEAQRIAIAEACGWRDIQYPIMFSALMPIPAGIAPAETDRLFSTIPDYLNLLDAMHEAENALMKPGLAEWCDYTRHLRRICGISLYAEIHATAAQRAEAFLKTLNLWTE